MSQTASHPRNTPVTPLYLRHTPVKISHPLTPLSHRHTPVTAVSNPRHTPSYPSHTPVTPLHTPSHTCHTPVTPLSHPCHTPVTPLPHARPFFCTKTASVNLNFELRLFYESSSVDLFLDIGSVPHVRDVPWVPARKNPSINDFQVLFFFLFFTEFSNFAIFLVSRFSPRRRFQMPLLTHQTCSPSLN
jgi:hypothetical protein